MFESLKKHWRTDSNQVITLALIPLFVFTLILLGVFSKDSSTKDLKTINCDRKEYFSMPEEFLRALSLVKQRTLENVDKEIVGPNRNPNFMKAINSIKCIDIQYAPLREGTEGVFLLDKNSSLNDLKIYVNESYKESDDTLTALLLSHELTHAGQYISRITGGEENSCIYDEEEAFMNQFDFLNVLNKEERNSLLQRIFHSNVRNPVYQGIIDVSDMAVNAAQKCESEDCFQSELKYQLLQYVANNPFYQKQCYPQPTQ